MESSAVVRQSVPEVRASVQGPRTRVLAMPACHRGGNATARARNGSPRPLATRSALRLPKRVLTGILPTQWQTGGCKHGAHVRKNRLCLRTLPSHTPLLSSAVRFGKQPDSGEQLVPEKLFPDFPSSSTVMSSGATLQGQRVQLSWPAASLGTCFWRPEFSPRAAPPGPLLWRAPQDTRWLLLPAGPQAGGGPTVRS